MGYNPYLIANFSTGVDKRLQPWLIPDDAQEQLLDGYVYRGTMSKRDGYNYLATGERGGSTYRESRIVSTLTAVNMVGVIDSANQLFTLAGTVQIARGSVTVTGTTPAQSFTDNGLGEFYDGLTLIGTVNYITGAISITLPAAPTAGTVTVTYSFMSDNPVMMIANFITDSNIKQMIVASTKYVNLYNTTLNILEDISTTTYTGTKSDFFTWVNYETDTSDARLLFCNNVDVIQQYTTAGGVATYAYNMLTSSSVPVPVTTLICSFMVEFKDRLILLRTTENGTIYGKRIRISGTGANTDDFRTSATGAGFIDIPDATWIQGAAFSRDDLLIFTEQATWALKFTGNDTTPFTLNRIDESRGCDATFSVITYLNKTSAVSKRGLIISDGYRVERQDIMIPDFTFNEIDGENFNLCFAGTVDADRDHYLIYPPMGNSESKRILTTNYDEENYSTYRLPLSCMGTYRTAFNVTWNDLLNYENWATFGAVYSNWNNFSYSKGTPFSVGGGHHGEIWQLAVSESEDNPVNIYNITVVNNVTLQITTDWNNYVDGSVASEDSTLGADYIYFSAIGGMQEINNHQFPITLVTDHNVFNVDISTLGILGSDLTEYTSGGIVSRVIPFSSLMKKFNPYVEMNKKVRCGWIYMYVDSTGTVLKKNIEVSGITNANLCIVSTVTEHGLSTGDQVSFFQIGGTTELNGKAYFITVIDDQSFSLDGVDSTSYGVFTSGGYASASVDAKLEIEIITNDVDHPTQPQNLSLQPYKGNMTNLTFEDGSKKWYKVFINQTGRFIQFRFKNTQSGANINIQATMPGFAPVGRLI